MRQRFNGSGKNVPPCRELVVIYFLEKGMSAAMAVDFFAHFDSRKWLNHRNCLLANWKTTAWEWIMKEITDSKSRPS